MTTEHYKQLLSLYKMKVAGKLTENIVSSKRLEAKKELDRSYVMDQPIDDIKEFINELTIL